MAFGITFLNFSINAIVSGSYLVNVTICYAYNI